MVALYDDDDECLVLVVIVHRFACLALGGYFSVIDVFKPNDGLKGAIKLSF